MALLSLLQLRRVVLVAFLTLALRLRFDWGFRRRFCLTVADTSIGKAVILRLTRALLGYIVPPILINYWYVWPTHHAQDGRPYFDQIKYVRRTRYGPHPREEMDELLLLEDEEHHPKRPQPASARSVLGLAGQMAGEIGHLISLGFGHHPYSLPVRVGKLRKAPAVLFGHGGGWVCQGKYIRVHVII